MDEKGFMENFYYPHFRRHRGEERGKKLGGRINRWRNKEFTKADLQSVESPKTRQSPRIYARCIIQRIVLSSSNPSAFSASFSILSWGVASSSPTFTYKRNFASLLEKRRLERSKSLAARLQLFYSR